MGTGSYSLETMSPNIRPLIRYHVTIYQASYKGPCHHISGLLQECVTKTYFSYFWCKTYVVGTQKNHNDETVLLSTQNKRLNWWIRKKKITILRLKIRLFHTYNISNIVSERLNLYLLVSTADNLCKQFGPRSGPTNRRACSWSKLLDFLMVFLKEFFNIVDFEVSRQQKNVKKISGDKELISKYKINILTLCLLANFACIIVVCGFFFSKKTFSKKSFRNTIRVSNNLDPDQAWHFSSRQH